MHQPVRPAPAARRLGARAVLTVIAFAAIGLGACSPKSTGANGSSLPTTNPSASAVAACIDTSTMAVIDQLKAPGADVASIVTANKDVLVNGLTSLQPADPATTTWRDALVKAIQDGDMTTAQTEIGALASGGVSLTAC